MTVYRSRLFFVAAAATLALAAGCGGGSMMTPRSSIESTARSAQAAPVAPRAALERAGAFEPAIDAATICETTEPSDGPEKFKFVVNAPIAAPPIGSCSEQFTFPSDTTFGPSTLHLDETAYLGAGPNSPTPPPTNLGTPTALYSVTFTLPSPVAAS